MAATLDRAPWQPLFFSSPAARPGQPPSTLCYHGPFAVIAPFIGPAIDRAANGRRLMVILIAFSRVLIGLRMIGNLDDLLLFPAALLMLVSGKAYGIAKSAIVPTTVSTDQELIEANSKLSIITGFSGLAAGIPGVILGWIGGPTWIIGFAIVVFALGTVLAFSLPQAAVAAEPVGEAEEAELRSRGIFLPVLDGLMRASSLPRLPAVVPCWNIRRGTSGRVGASVLGSFVGSVVAPRSSARPRRGILVLMLWQAAARLASWSGGIVAAVLVAFAGRFAPTRQAFFDHRPRVPPTPTGAGRSPSSDPLPYLLGVGAFIAVVFHSGRLCYLTIAVSAGFAASPTIGRRDAAAAGRPTAGSPPPAHPGRAGPPTQPAARPTVVDDVLASQSGVVEDFLLRPPW